MPEGKDHERKAEAEANGDRSDGNGSGEIRGDRHPAKAEKEKAEATDDFRRKR